MKNSTCDVLIIGGEGQLGKEIKAEAVRRGLAVKVAGHNKSTLYSGNGTVVEDYLMIKDLVKSTRPNRVINCAAFHVLDACEKYPDTAFEVNALGPFFLAEACKEIGAALVQISTDYVFGGQKPLCNGVTAAHPAWTVDDPPCPMNVYGYTKAMGEMMARRTHPKMTAVVRCSYMFGGTGSAQKGGNIVLDFLEKVKKGETLSYRNDVRFTPTYAVDAAAHVLDVEKAGVYHANNAGTTTPFDFVDEILHFLKLNRDLHGVSASQLAGPENFRPVNTALVPSFVPRGWRAALHAYLSGLEAWQLAKEN